MALNSETGSDSDERSSYVRAAIDRHEAQLIRYATRLLGDPDLARDAVQDTFVKLLGQPIDSTKGHLAEWLFTVCRNRSIDMRRRNLRMRLFHEGEAEKVTGDDPRPGRDMEAQETLHAVLDLVERLPPNQQEVVRLKFQNGFSYKQISRITSLSVSNVGFLLHTAIKRLRSEWSRTRALPFPAPRHESRP